MPRPPETTILALVSSGRSFLLSSWPTKLESPASPLEGIASMGALPPVAGAGSKPVDAHRHDLDLVGRLHRRQGIAGIDRAHEGVGRCDGADVRDLGHVEQRGRAWHEILAAAGGGGHDMAVAAGERHDELGQVLGQAVGIGSVIGQQHLGDAGDRRGGFRGGAAILAGHQHDQIAADGLGGGDGIEGRRLQAGVVVLGDEEDGHRQITLASLRSLSTSSATLFTLTPDLRLGGSATLRVFSRGEGSTPSCSGVTTSMGFFFAFMMLGKEA